jgi:DNA-binding transcriptional LysR family regulator
MPVYFLGIEAFLAVVRTQCVTKAAEELHLAQSSVSHRLKMLEQQVGATLIERGKGLREIRLTPTGEEFVQLAERWNSLWRETQMLQAQGPKLTLSLGTVDSLTTFFFPPLFREISLHQPAIRLTIRSQHSAELYEEVDRRQVDVAFVLREKTLPSVNVEQCFTGAMVVMRLANQASGAATIDMAELDPAHELYIPWGARFEAWHDKWWDSQHPSRIRLDSSNLIFHLLRDPRQWAIVPMWVANSALERGYYSVHRLSPAPPDLVCYRLTHKYPKPAATQSIAVFDHYFELFRLAKVRDRLDQTE